MIHLPASLAAWGSPGFKGVLRHELEQLDGGQLPLQQGLSHTSHALEDKFTVVVNGASEDARAIHAKVGIFYEGIVAGCNCADDPTPVEPQPEYCEVMLAIDKASAATTVTLLAT